VGLGRVAGTEEGVKRLCSRVVYSWLLRFAYDQFEEKLRRRVSVTKNSPGTAIWRALDVLATEDI
jgi:hypothetical protein